MNPAAAKRARDAIERRGQVVTFKRTEGKIPNQTIVTVDVKATVTGYKTDEIAGGITLGTRGFIVSTLALTDAGYPMPVRKEDKIISQGKEMQIDGIDANRREYTACLDIVATGQ
jgi:hypothetical protein